MCPLEGGRSEGPSARSRSSRLLTFRMLETGQQQSFGQRANAMRLQERKRSGLVSIYEAAVADHIGAQVAAKRRSTSSYYRTLDRSSHGCPQWANMRSCRPAEPRPVSARTRTCPTRHGYFLGARAADMEACHEVGYSRRGLLGAPHYPASARRADLGRRSSRRTRVGLRSDWD